MFLCVHDSLIKRCRIEKIVEEKDRKDSEEYVVMFVDHGHEASLNSSE